jgi:hypothetical protein
MVPCVALSSQLSEKVRSHVELHLIAADRQIDSVVGGSVLTVTLGRFRLRIGGFDELRHAMLLIERQFPLDGVGEASINQPPRVRRDWRGCREWRGRR